MRSAEFGGKNLLMFSISGHRNPSIEKAIAAIEPAFVGSDLVMLVEKLESATTTPIASGADLDAAFDELPHELRKQIAEAGKKALAAGAYSWHRRAEQVVQLIQRSGTDIALIRLIQLLFSLDLRQADQVPTLDLSSILLPGHLILRDLSIVGDLYLDGVRVMGAVDARNLRVGRGISGEQGQYLGPVWLTESDIKRVVRWGYSKFQSNVDATGTMFGGGIWLRYAGLQGQAAFARCAFESDSSFGACRYGGPVTFEDANFRDTSSFEGAIFESELKLTRATFESRVFFRDAVFRKGLSHNGARFLGEVTPPLHVVVPTANAVEKQIGKLKDAFGN